MTERKVAAVRGGNGDMGLGRTFASATVDISTSIVALLRWYLRLNSVTINMWWDVLQDPTYQKSLCTRLFIRVKPYVVKMLCWLVLFTPLLVAFCSRLFFWCYRALILFYMRTRYGNIRLLTGPETLFAQDALTAGILTRLLVLRGALDLYHIRQVIADRWVNLKTAEGQLKYPSFRQFVHYEWGYFVWRDDLQFLVEDHVIVSKGARPKNERELYRLVGHYRNVVFEREKAAWRVVLIPLDEASFPWSSDGVGPHYAALVMLDHAMGDGISIANLIVTHLADQPPETVRRHAAPDQSRLQYMTNPWNVVHFLFEAPSFIFSEFTYRDSNAMYGVKLTGETVFSTTRPIDFQVVKRIKGATGATVNDILLSCLADVLRTHFMQHKLPLPKKMNALIPVSMHRPGIEPGYGELSNDFSFICCPLPIGAPTAIERLALTTRHSSRAKAPAYVWFNYLCLKHTVNYYPLFFTRPFMRRRCTCLVSNVPFADQPLTLWGGHQLCRYSGLLSSQERIGCGVIFVTYNGQLQVGLNVDRALVQQSDDVDALAQRFVSAIDELERNLSAVTHTTVNATITTPHTHAG